MSRQSYVGERIRIRQQHQFTGAKLSLEHHRQVSSFSHNLPVAFRWLNIQMTGPTEPVREEIRLEFGQQRLLGPEYSNSPVVGFSDFVSNRFVLLLSWIRLSFAFIAQAGWVERAKRNEHRPPLCRPIV